MNRLVFSRTTTAATAAATTKSLWNGFRGSLSCLGSSSSSFWSLFSPQFPGPQQQQQQQQRFLSSRRTLPRNTAERTPVRRTQRGRPHWRSMDSWSAHVGPSRRSKEKERHKQYQHKLQHQHQPHQEQPQQGPHQEHSSVPTPPRQAPSSQEGSSPGPA